MPKKVQYKTEKDYDPALDFELPDFEYDIQKPKDNRTATEKIGKAVLKGASNTVFSAKTVEQIVRRSLPSSYGQGLNILSETSSNVQSLYNTALRDFKPTVSSLKQISRQILPKVEDKLPKKIADKLKNWSKQEVSYGQDLSKDAQRESALNIELGSIFNHQTNVNLQLEQQRQQREQFNQAIEQVRHKDNISQLNEIRLGIDRLTSYQDNVVANYHRKSLELQYRQYFVTADILDTARKSAAETSARFDAIVKNTALPEFAKLQNTERFSELTRNKFMEVVRDNMFGDTIDYIKRFTTNITRSLKEKITGTADLANMGLDAASMGIEHQKMLEEMGMSVDPKEAAGNMAGSFIGSRVVDKFIPGLGRILKNNQTVNKYGEKIKYGISNSGNLLESYLKDDSKSWKYFDGVRRFLGENAPGMESDVTMGKDELLKMSETMYFTRQTSKSLNEIIPGLLSHIHREIKILRTGNESLGLLTYDLENNTFKDSKVLGKQIRESIVGSREKQDIKNRVNEVIKFVENNSGKLSEADKKKLYDKISEFGFRRRNTDSSVVSQPETWGGGEFGERIASVMSALFEVDSKTGKRSNTLRSETNQRQFTELVKGITDDLRDPRARIQAMINAGQYDMLRQAGIIDASGNLNRRQILQDIQSSSNVSDDDSIVQSNGKVINRSNVTDSMTSKAVDDIALIDEFQRILQDTMGKHSVVDNTRIINDTLLRIEQSVNTNIAMAMSQLSREELKASADLAVKNKGFFNRTVGDVLKSGAKSTYGLGKSIAGHALKIGNRFDSLLYKTAGGVGRGLRSIKNAYTEVTGDIYVGDERTPRMPRVKIRAKQYIDKFTGKVVKSLKDITGDVIDIDGNLVLSKDEIKDAHVKGRGLVGLVGKTAGLAGSVAGEALKIGGRMSNILSIMTNGVPKVLKASIKALIPVKDVYVKGEQDPVLFKWKFLKNQYISKKSGKYVNHQKDIDGPILDTDGNTVLTEEQINKGLVDVDGKEIFFSIGNITQSVVKFGAGIVKRGFGVLKGIASGLGGIAGGIGDLLSNLFTGFTKVGKERLEIAKLSLDVQKRIFELLDNRLPARKRVLGDMDGDGIRDGSYEDLLGKRKNSSQKEESNSKKDAVPGLNIMGGLGSLLGGAKGLYDKLRGKNKEDSEDSGIMGSLGDVAGTAAGAAAGGAVASKAGILGRLGSGILGAGKLLGSGTLGAGKLGLAAGSGLLSLSGGALSLAGGLAMKAGAAALGMLSAPVVLTGLGLVGAYYGYKYLTRKKMDDLSEIRMAQYGFKGSQDEINAVFSLESMLEKHVSISQGKAVIDESKIDPSEVAGLFGINLENDKETQKFKTWYEARFKPVFIGHLSYIRSKYPNVKLSDIGSELSDEQKISYINNTTLPGVNYNLTISPFKNEDSLKVDSLTLSSIVEIKIAKLKKNIKKDKEETKQNKKEKDTKDSPENTKRYGDLKTAVDELKENNNKLARNSVSTQATYSGSDFVLTDKNRLDALQSMRVRLYGLVNLDKDKVNALFRLESECAPFVKFSGNKAQMSVDVERLLDTVKSYFGVSGLRSPQGRKWFNWFNNRFTPVFLNYAQGVMSTTGSFGSKNLALNLKPDQQLVIADLIKSSTGSKEGRVVPVWDVIDSPWQEYVINSAPDSIEGNYKAIVEVNKAVAMGETSSVVKEQNKRINDYKKNNPPKPTGNPVTDAINRAKHVATNNTPYRTISSSGAGMVADGGYFTGQQIQHPGQGTGGDINKLAKPTGNGWSNMKDTVIGAAQMTGVDSKALAALFAVESNFVADARPINRATGTPITSAAGIGQFLDGTWNEMIKKYGAKYGIAPGTPQTDPRASALLGAEYMKENIRFLSSRLKRPLTTTDVYLAHFLGPGGAVKFLTADRSEIAAKILPEAASKNKNVFYRDGGRTPLTVGEIYDNFTKKLENRLRQAGATDSDFGNSGSGVRLGNDRLAAPKGGFRLKLEREGSDDGGTYGSLTLPDGSKLVTLELPWKENQPQRSCIPPGQYTAAMRVSPKFGNVYEIQKVPGRSNILIHAGNFAGDVDKGLKSDVSGCILLGLKKDNRNGQKVITNSKEAMATFHQKMGGQPFVIDIINSINDQVVKVDNNQISGYGKSVTNSKTPMGELPVSNPSSTIIPNAQTTPQTNQQASRTTSSPAPGSSSTRSNQDVNSQQPTPNFKVFDRSPTPNNTEIRAIDKANRTEEVLQLNGINKVLTDSLRVQSDIRDILIKAVSKIDQTKIDNNPEPKIKFPEKAVDGVVSMKKN